MLCSFLLLFSSLTIFSLFPFCYFMSHNFILISPFHLPLQTCETEHFPRRKKILHSCRIVRTTPSRTHTHEKHLRHAHATPTSRPRHAHITPTSRPRHTIGVDHQRPRPLSLGARSSTQGFCFFLLPNFCVCVVALVLIHTQLHMYARTHILIQTHTHTTDRQTPPPP